MAHLFKPRILYGVHGYGRGHAARAQAILPELTRRYDVRVLAGDDAYDQLHEQFEVVRVPVLRYYHGIGGRRSAWLTIKRNTPGMLDMLLEGPIFQMVRREIRQFNPHVVISDSEGWTHRSARALGVPRIGLDHYGIIQFCRLDMSRRDRLIARAEAPFYRIITAAPERIIVVAFYRGRPRRRGVRAVGPVLRSEVRDADSLVGDYLLVYFSNAEAHFTPRVERALKALDAPVKVYHPSRRGAEGNVEFHPIANLPFVRDLAGCRAVMSTAGNQLISESIHFCKPMLLLPEESLEQRLNARYVSKWRIGVSAAPADISSDFLRKFLSRTDEFAANIPSRRRDGLAEMLKAIDKYVEELTSKAKSNLR